MNPNQNWIFVDGNEEEGFLGTVQPDVESLNCGRKEVIWVEKETRKRVEVEKETKEGEFVDECGTLAEELLFGESTSGKNPESTLQRRSRLRGNRTWGTGHFGDDELPRPTRLQRIAKRQRSSSKLTASYGVLTGHLSRVHGGTIRLRPQGQNASALGVHYRTEKPKELVQSYHKRAARIEKSDLVALYSEFAGMETLRCVGRAELAVSGSFADMRLLPSTRNNHDADLLHDKRITLSPLECLAVISTLHPVLIATKLISLVGNENISKFLLEVRVYNFQFQLERDESSQCHRTKKESKAKRTGAACQVDSLERGIHAWLAERTGPTENIIRSAGGGSIKATLGVSLLYKVCGIVMKQLSPYVKPGTMTNFNMALWPFL
ncbi:hypothetical protein Tco_0751734 [Tanacetum coccineum]|uniref:Uncharacterized protein n=1 Tax=Tanacetum coccineum TaxID=301880 RepID=A0ABQ4Z8I4_9ASTR